MEHGLICQFRITGSTRHKRIWKLFSTGLQWVFQRNIVDWAGEWGQGALQMCGDQLLLVHENKTPLASWDPSLIPKDRPYMLAKGLETLSDPGFCPDAKHMYQWTRNSATQPPYYHHHHRWDTSQNLAVMVRQWQELQKSSTPYSWIRRTKNPHCESTTK